MVCTWTLSVPNTRNCTGSPPAGRSRAIDAAPDEGEVGVEGGLDFLQYRFPRLAAPGHHQQLAKIEVGGLHVEQVEARDAAADVAGHGNHVGVAAQAGPGPLRAGWVEGGGLGSQRSTISSGRSEAGKNCLGTRPKSASDATKASPVPAMTSAMDQGSAPPGDGRGRRSGPGTRHPRRGAGPGCSLSS